jgi:UDP-GlcNAc:undecaprenyl-phosphate GlcNAc-1-phosphate transferase
VINVPLTVLWIVGLTNAMNFFDGVDGLAAGLSGMTAAFFGTVAFLSHQAALGWFAVALVGSCLGFIPYNFRFHRSAAIFLGDAGSTFLGFTLAGLAILGRWSTVSPFVSIAVPILILGVLIFDITYVTLSRIRNRQATGVLKAISSPGRDHLHHRLLRMGFLPKEAVFIILTLCACFGVSALIIMDQNIVRAMLGLFQALLVLGVFVVLMLKGREIQDS